ncbi:MAG: TIGR01777 family oxidoreductase [Bacteroidales bacterium]|nr:TIGR01777 family oxidoreductase [Bacteroidales bacterium]
MVIAISGSGGFIGKQLTAYFQSKGNEVRRILRINAGTSADEIVKQLLAVDVIINLAGAPIIGRWTRKYKKTLLNSRIITTQEIVEAISLMDKKPQLLISASAVGIYSPVGEQTESNFQIANDYLGQICTAWETEAKKAVPFTRVAIARFGIVLGKEGGMLKRLLPLFRLGLGGKIASGKQGFSWIHVYDVIQAMEFIIENPGVSGEFNFTAPNVVNNIKFTQVLAKMLGRRSFFTVPSFALKLLFGEGAIAITGGQFAFPKHLVDKGFQFNYPDLKGALDDITAI